MGEVIIVEDRGERMTVQELAEQIFVKEFVESGAAAKKGSYVTFDDVPDGYELAWPEFEEGLELLCDVGLIERATDTGYQVTAKGRSAGRDRSRARAAIWEVEDAMPTGDTINIGSVHGPTQIGHGNTQNVTTHLESVVTVLQKDPSMNANDKGAAIGMVDKLKAAAAELMKHLVKAGASEVTKEAVKQLLS